MKRVSRCAGAAALALSMAAVAAAQAPALDIKYGLWEVTSVSSVSGQMPVDTSNMTPEQKAKVEEAMKSIAGTHNDVSRSCVTKEKFEKSVFMMGETAGMNCSQKLTTNSRSALDATITCTGVRGITGQMHIDALSPTSMKGLLKTTTSDQGRTMSVNVQLTGKWLGADCGSEK